MYKFLNFIFIKFLTILDNSKFWILMICPKLFGGSLSNSHFYTFSRHFRQFGTFSIFMICPNISEVSPEGGVGGGGENSKISF